MSTHPAGFDLEQLASLDATSPAASPTVSAPQEHRSGDQGTPPQRLSPEELIERLRPTHHLPVSRWRRMLGRGPDSAVVERARDEEIMRQGIGRPLVILVAQPKGGSGKTPTTIGLSGAFGSARGSGVVAWDNNEFRGTLLNRLELSTHSSTADLIAHQAWFSGGRGSLAELEAVLNRQGGTAPFQALGSEQRLLAQGITANDVRVIYSILARFFSVIIIDSGNNENSANFKEALRLADVIVVPLAWREDYVMPARAMLTEMDNWGLQTSGRTFLVATARAAGVHDPRVRQEMTADLKDYTIVDVPPDPGLDAPRISWDQLTEASRRAFRHVGAMAVIAAAENTHPSQRKYP